MEIKPWLPIKEQKKLFDLVEELLNSRDTIEVQEGENNLIDSYISSLSEIFSVNSVEIVRISEHELEHSTPVIYLPLGNGTIEGENFESGDLIILRSPSKLSFRSDLGFYLLAFIPSFLENLPIEVRTNIGSFLSNTDLASLISTSRSVHFEPPVKERRLRECGVHDKPMEYWPIFLKKGSAYTECYQYFLDKGADIRADDNYAIRVAAERGHLEVVKLLLSTGLTVEDLRARNNYALRLAAREGHFEVVKLLLSSGLTVEDIRAGGIDPVVYIYPEDIDYMQTIHADENYSLRLSAANGHLDVVKLLLMADGNNGDGEALRVAAERGHHEIVKLLLSAGVPIEAVRISVKRAIINGQLEVVELLLSAGLTKDDILTSYRGVMIWGARKNGKKMENLLGEFIKNNK